MRRHRYGDRALLVDVEPATAVHALAAALRDEPPAGLVDLVPAEGSVLVVLAAAGDVSAAERHIDRLVAGIPGSLPAPPPGEVVEIPTVYDGPDLADVARETGLTTEEVVRRHAAPQYVTRFVGFAPGFAYLGTLDGALHLPRLATPRTRVPAGSVAVADDVTAVYPTESPGGWRLLGRTSAVLFDPDADPPAPLSAGTPVRFVPVPGPPGPGWALPRRGPRPPLDRPGAALRVITPGPSATVQDLGRPGWAHLGVPHSGAADRPALRRANALLGNPPGAAAVEITLGGLVVEAHGSVAVVLTGAEVPATVDGLPVRMGAPLLLRPGSVLSTGSPPAGVRTYLGVRGGVEVPPVLGSRSRDVLAALGPDPLAPGDLLPVGRSPSTLPQEPWPDLGASVPPARVVLDVLPGPRRTAGDRALVALCGADLVVSDRADRVGLRLAGPAVPQPGGPRRSEGLVSGAVQVPPDGQPVVFLADHPVTGGYPVVAVLTGAALPLAAQLRPGQTVRLRAVGAPASDPGGSPPPPPLVRR